MKDEILLRKIQIWLNLPAKYKEIEREISSAYGNVIVRWDNMLIIKEIYIKKEFRGMGIWSSLMDDLECLDIKMKLQSVLNERLMKNMISRGWKRLDYELSVIWIKSI